MKIHAIRSEKDYQEALEVINRLLHAPENSEEAENLEVLSILVEAYEDKHYRIEAPDPIAAIKSRIEQLGLTRKELEKSIGARSRISEVLGKKRNLTLSMIRKLHKNLNIPADILIAEYRGRAT